MSGARLELAGPRATVTIDRPEVLNAVDGATQRELEEIWRELERRPEVRVVVLTGAGERAFSVGDDMKAAPEGGDDAADAASDGLRHWAHAAPAGFGGIALRTTLDVPVLARVNGYALGGGLEMVLGCDLAIAAEHAQLGLTEPRVGRMAIDGGIALLTRRVPRALAMELLLTGRRIDAAEAARIGLVNRVVPAAELDAAVDELVDELLACAPLALRAIKRTATLDAREVLRVKAREPLHARSVVRGKLPALLEAFDSDDSREGVQAFLEKRAPRWSS